MRISDGKRPTLPPAPRKRIVKIKQANEFNHYIILNRWLDENSEKYKNIEIHPMQVKSGTNASKVCYVVIYEKWILVDK